MSFIRARNLFDGACVVIQAERQIVFSMSARVTA